VISPRYLTVLCALLALPLVPTIIHSYAGVVGTDSLTTRSIPLNWNEYASSPSTHDADWGRRRFEATDWVERRYAAPGDEILLTVIRSYDLKRLYHHPELDIAYGIPFLKQEVRRFPEQPQVPVHVLYTTLDRGSIAVYALHYDGEFVEDPVRFQIRSAAGLLFGGRRQMTLLFARDTSAPAAADVATLPVTKLLFAAIEHFTGAAGK
jgi:hypothetical protein